MVTREHVKKALELIRRRADYEYFFDSLDSPDWLEPLFQEGVFEFPDGPLEHDGKSVSFPFWSPAMYLARVAKRNPEMVRKIIHTVPKTENPRIHESFVEAALEMPPEIAVGLVHNITSWLHTPYQLLLHRKVAQYVRHLIKGGFIVEGFQMAGALFDIKLNERKTGKITPYDFRTAEPIIRSDWEYGECLKEVTAELRDQNKKQFILILAEKLEKAMRLEDRISEKDFVDNSHIWRPAIENSAQNLNHGIKDMLVNWIRDLSDQLMSEHPELAWNLIFEFRKKPLPIFSRFSLNTLIQQGGKETSKFILDEQLFAANDVWHEYARLIEKQFVTIPATDQAKFFKLIESYTRYSRDGKDPGLLARANEMAKYEYYYMVQQYLKGRSLQRFSELKSKFGKLENPTFRGGISVMWTGPLSPNGAAELDTMSTDELLKLLTTWVPPERQPGPHPTRTGLARELEALVSRKPDIIVNALSRFQLPQKSYVRAIIQGFAKPLSESRIKWEQVLEYVLWASTQKDTEKKEFNYLDDQDPSWSWTRTSACRLLEGGLKAKNNDIPISLRVIVWNIIVNGLSDSDPESDREDKSSNNPYQIAINCTRGVALETAIYFGFWIKKHGDADAISYANAKELYGALDVHLDLSKDPSRAIRSVYGRWTPWLRSLDVSWFRININSIFPDDPKLENYWWAAWESYILFCDPYSDILPEIRKQYSRAVNRLSTGSFEKAVDSYTSRLIQHLVTFYLIGKLDLHSDIIKEFYRNSNAHQRKIALDFIGRSLTNSDVPDELVIKRAEELWLYRLEECKKMSTVDDRIELSEFGWWMDSNFFSDDWLITQAINAVKVCHTITPEHIVLDRLTEIVQHYPAMVAELLKLLVDFKVSHFGFYGWLDKSGIVLSALLKTPSKNTAEEIIHKLGAYGFRDFGRLLKSDI